ncbi:MAG: arylesterase [Desulfobacterales bacterium]|jgi:acyl-CoA thioesterase-1
MNPIKKLTFIFFFALLMVIFMAGCSDESTPPSDLNSPEYEGIIVAVGDSLTEGLGVAEEFTYPALLEKKLQSQGHHYRVINAGVSGETSSGTLARINWILKLRPDIVILVIGANDGLRGIDPELIKTNLLTLVRKLKEKSVTVLLGGMQMARNLGEEYVSAFENNYPLVAQEEKVDLIPFFLTGVAANPNLNQADGIHPTAEGYRVIVDHIFPHVVRAIETHQAASS